MTWPSLCVIPVNIVKTNPSYLRSWLTNGVIACGAGTVYLSEASEVHFGWLVMNVRFAQSFIFYIVFCGSLSVFSSFFLFIFVVLFSAFFDYPCGFFKLFRIKRLINGLSLHNYQIRLITVVILVYIKTNMNDVLYDK